jgi:hypothetical protein
MCRSPDPEFLGLISPGSRASIDEGEMRRSIQAHCWERHPDTDAYCLLMGDHAGPHRWVQDNPLLVRLRQKYEIEVGA